MNETGSVSCSGVGCGVSGVKLLRFATTGLFVINYA